MADERNNPHQRHSGPPEPETSETLEVSEPPLDQTRASGDTPPFQLIPAKSETDASSPAAPPATTREDATLAPSRQKFFLSQIDPSVRARLADTLLARADGIRDQWCDALRHSGSPIYNTLNQGEFEAGLRVIFDGFVDFLRSGDPSMLGNLISAVARVRLSQGFALTDLEGSIAAMRAAVLPLVIREFATEPDHIAEAVAAIMTGEELASVRVAEAYQEVTAAEIQAAQDEALRAEHEKVMFCREMARVATHEKLILCDHEDIPVRPEVEVLSVTSPGDVRQARHQAAELSRNAGWDGDRSYALQLCIGEAGTNAIRHAGSATFQAWEDDMGAILFRLADTGPGIDFCRIPIALRSGFSTGSSLGMGFTLMLELADCICLATDHRGTTLQLTVKPKAK